MYRHGDTDDIIRVIMFADAQSAQYIRPTAARYLRGRNDRETLRNIYGFVKNNIRYRADRPGHEIVRGPAYLFDTGVGDCKSMSIAIGAMCRAMNIPYRYRFVSGRRGMNFHHVYVVATDRDANKDVALDAVYHDFDKQPPHVRRKDIRPGTPGARAAIAGMGALTDGSWILLLFLGIWLLMAKKVK